jgi:hypothetical protein
MSPSSLTSRAKVGAGEVDKPDDSGLNRRAHSTWWKRLFTVLEIAVFLASAGLVILLFSELTLGPLITLLIAPVFLAHLLRVAIIYIVEGRKPFSRHD